MIVPQTRYPRLTWFHPTVSNKVWENCNNCKNSERNFSRELFSFLTCILKKYISCTRKEESHNQLTIWYIGFYKNRAETAEG